MRLNLQHFSIRSTNALDSWVEQQILALGRLRQIDEANIRLAWHRDVSPAYHVRVHLVTPGPDVIAESNDHTLRAAVEKAIKQLEHIIVGRVTDRLRTAKNKLAPRSSGKPSRAFSP
jgi:ribosome-associated translation inhibitor RaiA